MQLRRNDEASTADGATTPRLMSRTDELSRKSGGGSALIRPKGGRATRHGWRLVTEGHRTNPVTVGDKKRSEHPRSERRADASPLKGCERELPAASRRGQFSRRGASGYGGDECRAQRGRA